MAIAFDAATAGGNTTSGSSITFAHTCTGTNRFLVVGVVGNTGTDNITGVTYAGAAMTLKSKFHMGGGADRWLYCFYKIAPASGANNVVVSSTASGWISAVASSYSGASQTAIDATQDTTDSASPLTNTLTTVADNAWHIGVGGAASGQPAASTATTRRVIHASDNLGVFDGNAAKTPPGSSSLVTTAGANLSMLGFDIGPTVAYTMTAAVGAFVLTGIAAALSRIYKIVCDAGSFTLTGVSATLKWFSWIARTRPTSTWTDVNRSDQA